MYFSVWTQVLDQTIDAFGSHLFRPPEYLDPRTLRPPEHLDPQFHLDPQNS